MLGDGRPYVASLRTDNWAKERSEPPDLWQCFLFAPEGQWHTVKLPLKHFLLTHKGRVRALTTRPCLSERETVEVGSHGRWKRPCLRTAPDAIR